MKGAILSRCPRATLVDITHQILPFAVAAGAYALAQAAPYFPAGTVHLAVVDPGVGTSRRPVVVRADHQIYVAPDNGLLSIVLKGKTFEAFEIANPAIAAKPPSQTFHGRDIFAPAAAALASGELSIEQVGHRIADLETLPDLYPHQEDDGSWRGNVLDIDRFGNIVTNFEASRHATIAAIPFRLSAGIEPVECFSATFGAAAPGVVFAYFGSSGFIEIGMNRSSAAAALGVRPGDVVQLKSLDSRGTLKK